MICGAEGGRPGCLPADDDKPQRAEKTRFILFLS